MWPWAAERMADAPKTCEGLCRAVAALSICKELQPWAKGWLNEANGPLNHGIGDDLTRLIGVTSGFVNHRIHAAKLDSMTSKEWRL